MVFELSSSRRRKVTSANALSSDFTALEDYSTAGKIPGITRLALKVENNADIAGN